MFKRLISKRKLKTNKTFFNCT